MAPTAVLAERSSDKLTEAEAIQLVTHEAAIERGLETFYEVGAALLAIRDARLYRGPYETFEQYCLQRWGIARRTAYQFIDAAAVVENVRNCAHQPPTTESQARELVALKHDPVAQRAAWTAATEIAPSGEVTARHVRDVVSAVRDVGLKTCPIDSSHLWLADLSVCPYCTKTPEERIAGLKSSLEERSKPHVSQNSGNNEWYTPEPIIKAARQVLGTIDLDPASSEAANKVVRAKVVYTADDDGLVQEWRGNVWMNPPYAQPLVAQFCDKLADSVTARSVTAAIVLVNNATETGWFKELAEHASAVCFPTGRIKFWSPDKEQAAPLQGQALLYIGPKRATFTTVFSQFGIVWVKP